MIFKYEGHWSISNDINWFNYYMSKDWIEIKYLEIVDNSYLYYKGIKISTISYSAENDVELFCTEYEFYEIFFNIVKSLYYVSDVEIVTSSTTSNRIYAIDRHCNIVGGDMYKSWKSIKGIFYRGDKLLR